MKSYKLHNDGFSVTVTVADGSAAGVYETDLHELTENVENGIWDTKRTIVVGGVEKNLKLRIDDCTELDDWVDAWRAERNSNEHTCFDCGCHLSHGAGTRAERLLCGSRGLVVLCPDCSDSLHSN